tara:strand:- start:448 stop:687 length:240 start_codon:yes stop_codon:yes gene_type:complete
MITYKKQKADKILNKNIYITDQSDNRGCKYYATNDTPNRQWNMGYLFEENGQVNYVFQTMFHTLKECKEEIKQQITERV